MLGRDLKVPLQYFRLTEHTLNHPAVDIGQAVMAALEEVGQAFVVEAEEVEDGRVKVMFSRSTML